MSGLLRPGSAEARLVYRLMAGEQIVTHAPAPGEEFVPVTAAVVHRLMSLHPSPLVVWLTGTNQPTIELSDALAVEFARLGQPPLLRPHDQAANELRYAPGEGHIGADHIPMVEARFLPQQATISHLLIVDLSRGQLPVQIPADCLSQVLAWGDPTSEVLSFFQTRLRPDLHDGWFGAVRTPPWGDIPLDILLAGDIG